MLKAMHETKQQVKKARCFIEGNLKRQEERWCKVSVCSTLYFLYVHILCQFEWSQRVILDCHLKENSNYLIFEIFFIQ